MNLGYCMINLLPNNYYYDQFSAEQNCLLIICQRTLIINELFSKYAFAFYKLWNYNIYSTVLNLDYNGNRLKKILREMLKKSLSPYALKENIGSFMIMKCGSGIMMIFLMCFKRSLKFCILPVPLLS